MTVELAMSRSRGLAAHERVIELQGAANFRDCGGYPCAGGGHVRWGRLFRSGKLSDLTDADIRRLEALGIRSVFDLRAPKECRQDPTRWSHPDLRVSTYPKGGDRRLIELPPGRTGDADGALALMTNFYAAIPFELAPAFKAMLRDLSQGAHPCIVHCSAGKDRTGVAIALVLTALGVEREIVVQDYQLTQQLPRPVSDMARAVDADRSEKRFRERFSAEAIDLMMSANIRFIATAFTAMEERHGSVTEYMRCELGADEDVIAGLRHQLLG